MVGHPRTHPRNQKGTAVSTPEAAYIEIIEKTADANPLVIVPNEIRINGVPLLAPADDPVVVHEISMGSEDIVKVTLTLYARRVVIGHEVTS